MEPVDFFGQNNSNPSSPVEDAVAESIAGLTFWSANFQKGKFYWSGHGDIFGPDALLQAAMAGGTFESRIPKPESSTEEAVTQDPGPEETPEEKAARIKASAAWSAANLSVVLRVPTERLLERFRGDDRYPSYGPKPSQDDGLNIDDLRLGHGWEQGRYRGITCAPSSAISEYDDRLGWKATFVNYMHMKRSFGADFFRYYGPENIYALRDQKKYPFHFVSSERRFRENSGDGSGNFAPSRKVASDNVPVHSMAHHLSFDYCCPELTWLIDRYEGQYSGALSLRAIELLAYDQISPKDYQSLYLVFHFQAAYITSDTLHKLSLMPYRQRNQNCLFDAQPFLQSVVKLASDKLNMGLGEGVDPLFNLVLLDGNFVTNKLEPVKGENPKRHPCGEFFEVPEFLRYVPSCFRTISAIPVADKIPPQSSDFRIAEEDYQRSWSTYWANLLVSDVDEFSLFFPLREKLLECAADGLSQNDWQFSVSDSCLASVARKDMWSLGVSLQPFAQTQTRFLDIQILVQRQIEELSSLRLAFARMIKEHGEVKYIETFGHGDARTLEEKLKKIQERKKEIRLLSIKFFNFYQYLWANFYFAFPFHRFVLEQIQEIAGVKRQYKEFERLLSLQSAVVDGLVESVRIELDRKAAEDRDERNKKLERQNEIREKWNLGLAFVGAIVAGEPIGDMLATFISDKSDLDVAACQTFVMIAVGVGMFLYMDKDRKKLKQIQQEPSTELEDQSE